METRFYSRSGRSVSVPSEWFGKSHSCALGLSRAEMDLRLLTRARGVGVKVLEEAQASDLWLEGERVRGVRLKTCGHEMEISAPVIVDATGRGRALARRVEKDEAKDARTASLKRPSLVAFKAHLENAGGMPRHCEIYFYRGGYGGLSRVENGLSNLCFIASASDVRACGNDPERVMREILMKNRRAAETLSLARPLATWLAVALEGFGRRRLVPAEGLLSIGDAASFIDPFTGSGMLMALESGELAAQTILSHLGALRQSDAAFMEAAADYRAAYQKIFGARLRVCALMRRAAFIPRFAETLIFALGASRRARRYLAQATRGDSDK
jgi:flavin-dependent dehydrogenase